MFEVDQSHIGKTVQSTGEILSIQYLRAIAALLVVVFHFLQTENYRFPLGNFGVDIFFVISGFIMYYTTRAGKIGSAKFFVRRIERIVPIYWAATLATCLFVAIGQHYNYGSSASPRETAMSLLFIPYKNRFNVAEPVVVQGWTLNYEMFFYVVFAAAVSLPRKLKILVVSLLLVCCVLIGLFIPNIAQPLKTWTSPLLLEFLAGIFLGRLFETSWFTGYALAVCCVAAALGAMTQVLSWTAAAPGGRFLISGIPAALLVGGMLAFEKRRKMPDIPILRYLGDASYSIYIWHVLFGALGMALYEKLHGPDGPLKLVTVFCAGIGCSLLAYQCIEKPIANAFRHLRPRPATKHI